MKKLTLAVTLPVLNEEKTVAAILQSLLKQKQKSFILKRITVYSDASTDQTHEIVRELSKHNPLIQLKVGKKRIGKYLRMNQMFRECSEDVLVILDADILLDGNDFLERLATVIRTDPGAQMVSAHQVLMRPKTFIEKVIYAKFILWDCVRLSIPGLHSAHNFFASATAFRGEFIRTIEIPKELSDPHLYLYLLADAKQGFRYCMDARIFQWAIGTVADYKKFLKRALGKRDKTLERLLGVDTRHVYDVPFRIKAIGLLKALWLEPFFTPLGLVFNIYMHKIRPMGATNSTSLWDVVTSTKKAI